MNAKKYNMSFVAGALLRRESLVIASIYISTMSWDSTKKEVFDKNRLQARTTSTLHRIYGEVILRLKCLSDNEIAYLNSASTSEQGYTLWLAICRRYVFIAEFANEVLREKFISLKQLITYDDYDSFFNTKADWHPELDVLTQNTQKKLRQVLFRMLKEAGLLTKDNHINAAVLTRQMEYMLNQGIDNERKYFPVVHTAN